MKRALGGEVGEEGNGLVVEWKHVFKKVRKLKLRFT